MLKTFIGTVISGIISGVFSSIIFWLLFFKFTFTKICISNIIVRQKNVFEDGSAYRYRIRICNAGFVNLMEADATTTIRIVSESGLINSARVLLLPDGHYSIFKKRPRYCKLINRKEVPHVHVSTISLTETSLKEYEKTIYDKCIQEKAKAGTLTLEDLIKTYNENHSIRIVFRGTDAFSGRRIFLTKDYYVDDIKQGRFKTLKKQLEEHCPGLFSYKEWIINAITTIEAEQ